MKLNGWILLGLAGVASLAAGEGYGAHLAVLGVTLGIFFGTLSLRRTEPGEATSTNPGHG